MTVGVLLSLRDSIAGLSRSIGSSCALGGIHHLDSLVLADLQSDRLGSHLDLTVGVRFRSRYCILPGRLSILFRFGLSSPEFYFLFCLLNGGVNIRDLMLYDRKVFGQAVNVCSQIVNLRKRIISFSVQVISLFKQFIDFLLMFVKSAIYLLELLTAITVCSSLLVGNALIGRRIRTGRNGFANRRNSCITVQCEGDVRYNRIVRNSLLIHIMNNIHREQIRRRLYNCRIGTVSETTASFIYPLDNTLLIVSKQCAIGQIQRVILCASKVGARLVILVEITKGKARKHNVVFQHIARIALARIECEIRCFVPAHYQRAVYVYISARSGHCCTPAQYLSVSDRAPVRSRQRAYREKIVRQVPNVRLQRNPALCTNLFNQGLDASGQMQLAGIHFLVKQHHTVECGNRNRIQCARRGINNELPAGNPVELRLFPSESIPLFNADLYGQRCTFKGYRVELAIIVAKFESKFGCNSRTDLNLRPRYAIAVDGHTTLDNIGFCNIKSRITLGKVNTNYLTVILIEQVNSFLRNITHRCPSFR